MYYFNGKLMEQTYFNYYLKPNLAIDDFYVGKTNKNAFNLLLKNFNLNSKFFLYGPKKSGKTHLSIIWKNQFNAILYDNNFQEIINKKQNILIDNLFRNLFEEEIFHIINHCDLYRLKILITSDKFINLHNFKLKDLSSRLQTFIDVKIDLPDDELLINLINKLFHDKQIIVKNPEIFNYIVKRTDRSYENIFLLVDRIVNLIFKKNKQLTIPLIRELI